MIDGMKSLQRITQVIMSQLHFAYKLEAKLLDVITSAFRTVSKGMSGYNFLSLWSFTVLLQNETPGPTLKHYFDFFD